MKRGSLILPALCVAAIMAAAGFIVPAHAETIMSFPMDSLDGVITRSGVTVDTAVSSDGDGSLRIETSGPVVVRLFEVENLNVEDARLIYQAKLRTENLRGQAYLEMWLRFPEKGEFFSRGLQDALSGSNEWSSAQTPFFLQKGEVPDLAKLNLVINGKGVVWIDEVALVKGPLR